MIERIYSVFEKSKLICTDTRSIQKGAVFFAIKGDNFDGNKFAEDAIKLGCEAAVVSDKSLKNKDKVFYVEDTIKALQELAQIHRDKLGIPVLAITGSNGKTTTKELLAAVLSRGHRLSYTRGNKNNHIGLPLTLLAMNSTVDMAVVEMGANSPGEIKMLCNIAKPNFGIITNIGVAHIEGFKSIKGITKAKGELYEYLKNNNGTIFVNTDSDVLNELLGDYDKFISYGKNKKAYCVGEYVENQYYAGVKWRTSDNQGYAKSNLIGEYNFENILAAISVGNYFKIPPSVIDNAINNCNPQNSRSQLIEGDRNSLFIDLYNANPTSMMAALNNFNKIENGNKCLILGDMLELGRHAKSEHKKVLDFINKQNYDTVYLVGSIFMQFKDKYSFKFFNNSKELSEVLIKEPHIGKTFLIKGSRGIRLEKCTDYL